MTDEILFSVQDAKAVRAEPISLEEAGLRERDHLQEWVVANPDVLGSDVLIVAIEFGKWLSSSGSVERDRLDVLGLGSDGRLVVAELKRDRAPDATEMQGIKYAALASRFDPDRLAEVHADYRRSRGEEITEADALDRLAEHTQFALDAESLRSPRIVLIAREFPPVLTSTVVWLSEMGVDLALVKFQAYRVEGQIVVSMSRIYPVADVEDFTVAPTRTAKRSASQSELPKIPWTIDELREYKSSSNATVMAAMDLCSASPGDLIPFDTIIQAAERTHFQARSDLAVNTKLVKARFGRSNSPFDAFFSGPSGPTAHYRVDEETAEIWRSLATDPTKE